MAETTTGPDGGKQKLSPQARRDKQARDKAYAMTKGRKDESKANHLRVPKLIDAAIAFQVIHKQTPDLRMAKWEGDEGFYGIVNKGVGVGKETNYGGGDYLFEGEFPIKDNSEEKIF